MSENKNEVMENEMEEPTVELVDDQGRVLKFFHIGTMDYKEKVYAFFMPAEEIEGTSMEEVVIFNVAQQNDQEEVLLPVEDEALLEEVYEEFCRQMDDEASALEAEELEGGHCHCGCCEDDCDCDCDDENCDCDGEGECDCGCHHKN